MGFGKKIRAARRALHLRQPEVADALGISVSYYSQVESGTRKAFPMNTIDYDVLAEKLQLDPKELLADAMKDWDSIHLNVQRNGEGPRDENLLQLARYINRADDEILRNLLSFIRKELKDPSYSKE